VEHPVLVLTCTRFSCFQSGPPQHRRHRAPLRFDTLGRSGGANSSSSSSASSSASSSSSVSGKIRQAVAVAPRRPATIAQQRQMLDNFAVSFLIVLCVFMEGAALFLRHASRSRCSKTIVPPCKLRTYFSISVRILRQDLYSIVYHPLPRSVTGL